MSPKERAAADSAKRRMPATDADEEYADQTVERTIKSTSAASTTDRADAVDQLTASRKGGTGKSR